MLAEEIMDQVDMKSPERRNFLRSVPAAAAAGLAFAEALAGQAAAQEPAPSAGYKLISAETLHDDISEQQAHPGNKPLFFDRNFSIMLTSETAAMAKEFEWHEHRDHIFYIFDGSTDFELGGTPQNAHSPRAGEWLAPASEGATKVTLHKGGTLVIPRGTPHKRSTPGSVTFTLTAPMTPRSA
jgi:mannose-6-phosphate isomerase-like protein (cupin superfamily)